MNTRLARRRHGAIVIGTIACLLAAGCSDGLLGLFAGADVKVSIDDGPSGTVGQRMLSISGHVAASDSIVSMRIVVDPGLPDSMSVDVGHVWTDFLHGCGLVEFTATANSSLPNHRALTWRASFGSSLHAGSHRITVSATTAKGTGTARSYFTTAFRLAPYTVTALPGLGGGDAQALDINAKGDVVGWASDSTGHKRAVLWHAGALTRLVGPAPDTAASSAFAINSTGVVVGLIALQHDNCLATQGVEWIGGAVSTLPSGCAAPVDVNDSGTVLLSSAALLSGGTITPLAPNATGAQAVTHQLNNAGHVAFTNFDPNCDRCGVPVGSGVAISVVDDQTFFCTPSRGGATVAALNDNDYAVGVAGVLGLAWISRPNQTPIALGPMFGTVQAVDINSKNTALLFDPDTAWLYNPSTGPAQVSTPGWVLDAVTAINDQGVIIGHAKKSSTGVSGPVLLTPAGAQR